MDTKTPPPPPKKKKKKRKKRETDRTDRQADRERERFKASLVLVSCDMIRTTESVNETVKPQHSNEKIRDFFPFA